MPKFLQLPPPTWATDATYPAGALPWSGGPIRIAPSAGQIAAGFAPNTQPPAQYLNFVLGSGLDAAGVAVLTQAHAAMQRWTRSLTDVGSALASNQVVGMLPVRTLDTNGERARMPVLLGLNPALRLGVALSSDGSAFESPRVLTAFGVVSAPVASSRGAAGEILVANNALAGIFYSNNSGTTPSFATQTWGSNAKCAVHYAQGSATPYLVLDALGRYSAAASIAGLTTSSALPGVSALASTVAEFADDGGANIVLSCQPNTATVSTIYHSSDGGATFAAAVTLGGANANVVWSTARQLFIAWDASGAITTSPTGAVWTAVASGATSAKGFLGGYASLASVGLVIAKLWLNSVASGTFFQRGIAYSLDLGLTWNTWAFGEVTSGGSVLTQLRAINNRLYAVDGVGLWTSGQVGFGLSEF